MRRFGLFVAGMVGLALALPGASGAQLPTQDSVTFTDGPSQAGSFTIFTVDATSGPAGGNPAGQVRFDVFGGAFRLGGPVTCLAVTGNTATINFQDQLGGGFGITTVQVTDSSTDSFDALPINRAPTDCSPLAPTGLGGELLVSGNIVIVDAPTLPVSTDQCRNGGWQSYGIFKNQGDCVSFVATKGTNQPAGTG
jgi:hypothetical protein